MHGEKWVKASKITTLMLKEANIPIRVFDGVLDTKGVLDEKFIAV